MYICKVEKKGDDDMGQMINVNIRMDEDLKKQADYLFNELGLNMSTAVNMFVRQAVRTAGIPFEVTIRTAEPSAYSYNGKYGNGMEAESSGAVNTAATAGSASGSFGSAGSFTPASSFAPVSSPGSAAQVGSANSSGQPDTSFGKDCGPADS